MDKARCIDDNCNICGKQINTWDVKLSKALAYKKLICESCIAKEYDIEVGALRDRMEDFFGMRPCMGI